MRKPVAFGMAALALGAVAFGFQTMDSWYVRSLIHMNYVCLGTIMYSNDYDDMFPLGQSWMDGTAPYVAEDYYYNSPILNNPYGYALNVVCAGVPKNAIVDPDNTPLLFDSTVRRRNAVATVDTMPYPPRYGDRNTICFASGRLQDSNMLPPSNGGHLSAYDLSRKRLQQIDLALVVYSSDYDDLLPQSKWVDLTLPYIGGQLDLYRSPRVQQHHPQLFGFALNSDVAGRSLTSFDYPASTISIFDSTDKRRNAVEPTSTFPNPPRYGDKGNTWAFLDGHIH